MIFAVKPALVTFGFLNSGINAGPIGISGLEKFDLRPRPAEFFALTWVIYCVPFFRFVIVSEVSFDTGPAKVVNSDILSSLIL